VGPGRHINSASFRIRPHQMAYAEFRCRGQTAKRGRLRTRNSLLADGLPFSTRRLLCRSRSSYTAGRLYISMRDSSQAGLTDFGTKSQDSKRHSKMVRDPIADARADYPVHVPNGTG
jgi:hypothetical protein